MTPAALDDESGIREVNKELFRRHGISPSVDNEARGVTVSAIAADGIARKP
jgi:hypothetical protein